MDEIETLKKLQEQVTKELLPLEEEMKEKYYKYAEAMKDAKEYEKVLGAKRKEYNDINRRIEKAEINFSVCKCGHFRMRHGPSRNINYTGGMCLEKDCKCEHFLQEK